MPASRNLAAYKAIVEQTIGATPSTGFTTTEIVNDALKHLETMHSWNWLMAGPRSLSLTAGQNYVELPADFAEMESLQYPGTFVRSMLPTTLIELEMLRSIQVFPPAFAYYYATNLGAIDQTNPEDGLSVPTLELFPTPQSDEIDALTIWYRRKVSNLSSDTDVPQFPDWIEPMFVQIVRHYAYLYEDDNPGNSAASQVDMLAPQMMARDARVQRRRGVMRGQSDMDINYTSPFYPGNGIGDPSR